MGGVLFHLFYYCWSFSSSGASLGNCRTRHRTPLCQQTTNHNDRNQPSTVQIKSKCLPKTRRTILNTWAKDVILFCFFFLVLGSPSFPPDGFGLVSCNTTHHLLSTSLYMPELGLIFNCYHVISLPSYFKLEDRQDSPAGICIDNLVLYM